MNLSKKATKRANKKLFITMRACCKQSKRVKCMQLGTMNLTRFGMSYKLAEIVLVKFPFTDLKNSKKRPILIIKDENALQDILCLQITSNPNGQHLYRIESNDYKQTPLKVASYVKYNKCFTINSSLIDKKVSEVNSEFLARLKTQFCKEIF